MNGGLAEYSGIDALLWRVGFVALTLAGGTGVLVYLLLWILMPAGPHAQAGSAAQVRPRRPAGPRSPVPGVTIAVLLIVVGVLTLLSGLTDWDPGARGFLGSALLVVGLGLVAAAFSGGRTARGGLIASGVFLSFALVVASSAPWTGASGGIGERTYRPTTAAEVRSLYEIGVGEMTVDLTEVDLSDLDDPIRTRIDHGIGDLNVLVPRSADVIVQVDQAVGDMRVFGGDAADDGRLVPGTGSAAWTGDGRAEFVITVDMAIGDAQVSRG